MPQLALRMTTPVTFWQRVTTTDPSTGEARDEFARLADVLADVQSLPVTELDEAGRLRTVSAVRITTWRAGLAEALKVTDRVEVAWRERREEMEIASLAVTGELLVIEARSRESV